MARLNGSNSPNRIDGTRGDDVIYGYGGDDKLEGHGGDDWIHGGIGNDRVQGGGGNDKLDGGWGDDYVEGGRGNDTLTYIASENRGDRDWYAGGRGGEDTLRLEFTREEWNDNGLRREVARFEDWTDDHSNVPFRFHEIRLFATGFEDVEVFVDGKEVENGRGGWDFA